jgi:hypothetical protein
MKAISFNKTNSKFPQNILENRNTYGLKYDIMEVLRKTNNVLEIYRNYKRRNLVGSVLNDTNAENKSPVSEIIHKHENK